MGSFKEISLADLEPAFVAPEPGGWREGVPREEAQGVTFLCPACFAANGGPAGTHGVLCWSRSAGAPDDLEPGPGRWRMVGGLADLTLEAEPGRSASVLLRSGCGAHFYVRQGRIVNA